MSSQPVVLGAFIDTLVLNVIPTDRGFQPERRELRPDLKEELMHYKTLAQDDDEHKTTPYVFAGVPLLMTPKGGDGFFWILRSSKLSLAVNRNAKRAMFAQVRLSSEYLWSVRNLGDVLAEVHAFLMSFFDEYIQLQVSSVDLAVDLLHLDWGTVHNIRQQFITRAQKECEHVPADGFLNGPDEIHDRWRRLTGFSFGARKAAVSAVVYDKTHEIKYQSREKTWFFDLWQQAAQALAVEYSEEMQVWRIEIRLRREALNELKQEGVFHGINDAYDLEEVLPQVWAYLVGHVGGGEDGLSDGWLRYVVPTEDTNRSRWPVHPDWEVIQGVSFRPEVGEETEREREEREREELLQEVDAYLVEHPFEVSKSLKRARQVKRGRVQVSAVVSLPDFNLRPLIRQRKRQKNIEQMVSQLAGCCVTLEAWRSDPDVRLGPGVAPDLSDTVHYAYGLMLAYMEKKDRDFGELVQKKRPLYSIEAAS